MLHANGNGTFEEQKSLTLLNLNMLISKTFHDLPTKLDPAGRPIRIFVISPNVPNYPQAKFPGL
jgi:hypothetical protein